eukprot:Skav235379  [mRNA]  locus=scaffold59:523468:534606:- [translate_table: standard]
MAVGVKDSPIGSNGKCGNVVWDLESDKELGMPATELHGDLDQKQRDHALYSFKQGEAQMLVKSQPCSKVRVLVATDLASRGLDVRNCTVVVNFDAPKSQEDYVHRIGRTGIRTGQEMNLSTMVNNDQDDSVWHLEPAKTRMHNSHSCHLLGL